jgi:hypothetical protein
MKQSKLQDLQGYKEKASVKALACLLKAISSCRKKWILLLSWCKNVKTSCALASAFFYLRVLASRKDMQGTVQSRAEGAS